MPRTTILELTDKYKGTKLKFKSYYKYSFTFEGYHKSRRISAIVGGTSDEIYRYDVDALTVYKLEDLEIDRLYIYNGEELEAQACSYDY